MIDPLDYEAVISELGEELKEDPLKELLLFPDNDFSVSVCMFGDVMFQWLTQSEQKLPWFLL